MIKMLLIFLILITKALADSEENNYVDLLPDEEKQQFLDNVARRILKDVESQENVKSAQSGEMSDEQLKQHTEYVKQILKEEQANVRRNKAENDKNKQDNPSSEEKDNLGVKPLASDKISLSIEREDSNLRNYKKDAVSAESTTFNIKNQMIINNPPIIKRSVPDEDETNKSTESDEKDSGNEKSDTGSIPMESKNSYNSSIDKDYEIIKSANAKDEDDETKAVKDNVSDSREDDARNVSVKGIHEVGLRRINNEYNKLVENTTGNNTTITAVESVISKDNTSMSNEHVNMTTVDEESTTISYTFESSTTSNIENATTDHPAFQMTTAKLTNEDKYSEPIMKSAGDSLNYTQNKLELTTKSTGSTINVQETTELIPETTESIPVTIESITETTTGAEPVTTGAVTESNTVVATINDTTVSIPVLTTEEPKITVEHFTSQSFLATSVKPPKKNKHYTLKKQRDKLSKKVPTRILESDEESTPATTKNLIKHKVIVHKPRKVIIGPKAKKLAEAEKYGVQKNNFIELEKVYYDNNYKVKVGKQYHVYEIPAGETPFIKDEDPVVDQPYYVPVYNYSPNNAYFNPQNRLGPNAGDSRAENILSERDDMNEQDRTERLNVKLEYDRTYGNKRKKFGSKQKEPYSIYNQPMQSNGPQKVHEKVNPADNLDSGYYYGRVKSALARKVGSKHFNKFPNSDEIDHPAHSIQERNLKDHVRAVRNILFHHKSFGLLDKDKYGESIEKLRMGRKLTGAKQGLRLGPNNVFLTTNDKMNYKNNDTTNNIALDYDSGKDGKNNNHFQKVGYLKRKNNTKDLYVMDDFFKANVEKYIQEQGFTPATALPYQALDQKEELMSYLRQTERLQNNDSNAVKKDIDYKEDIPVHPNENNTSGKALDVKLNLRRNDIDKIHVYMEVLKDMVTLDNKALEQYDWLGTTVDIQAALQKLFELIALVVNEEDMHPADMEILKYVLFQHKLASEIIEANNFGAQLRKKLALPKNKRKKIKPRMLKEKGLINRVWLYLRKEVPQVSEYGALKRLYKFLINVEDGLYDLHDAVKNIAKITKYKNQHWYHNLRDLYLSTDEKHMLELLLHLSSLRLFTLIEESAKNGLEGDYVEYMKQNRKHCKRTLEEMMFIIDVLDEYNKYVM